MDEIVSKFTNLLRYVPYLKEEKDKAHRFMNFFPTVYKERIEFDNPKKMDELVRKERLCNHQFKNKGEGFKTCPSKEKFKVNMERK